MSTFTNWNGPDGCCGGPSVDVTAVISAYSELKTKLDAKADTTSLSSYLQSATAESTYLKKTDAASTYATKALLGESNATAGSSTAFARIKQLEDTTSKIPSTYATQSSLGASSDDATKNTAFGRIKALESKQGNYAAKSDVTTTNTNVTNLTNRVTTLEGAKTTDEAALNSVKSRVSTLETSVASKLANSTFTDHVKSHISQGTSLKLVGTEILGNDGKALIKTTDVSSTDGTSKHVIQLGNNDYASVFPQRPAVMIPDGSGKYTLKYLVTGDEIGTVPVGGIIRWPINWRSCPEGADLMEYMKLDSYNGEWLPCDGSDIPSGDATFDDLRAIVGETLPTEEYSIIHAKAAAEVGAIPADVWAMNVTTLEDTLRQAIINANNIIDKYYNLVAQQNDSLANQQRNIVTKADKTYVDGNFETKADAVTHFDVYARRSNLDVEVQRAQNAENLLGSQINAVGENLDTRATWAALSAEAKQRASQDNSLREQIMQEHIGSHDRDNVLNSEINKLRHRATDIESNLKNETADRKQADLQLKANDDMLDAEIDVVANDLQREAETRSKTDETLLAEITSKVAGEKSARESADNDLTAALDSEKSARESADNDLTAALDSEKSARESADNGLTAALDSEKSARESADNDLTAALDSEKSARESADNDLTAALDSEKSARESADSVISGSLDSETSAREAADSVLSDSIDAEKSARETADKAEEEARIKLEDDVMTVIEAMGAHNLMQFVGADVTALPQKAYDEDSHIVIADGQLVLLSDGAAQQKIYKAAVLGDTVNWVDTGYRIGQ